VRPRPDKAKLRGLEDLAMVAEVGEYLFFGSLCELQLTINVWLAERKKRLPKCRQERLLLLDFSRVKGMDARLLSGSAMLEVIDIVKQVATEGVATIFTGIDPYDREGACYRLPKIIDADPRFVYSSFLLFVSTLLFTHHRRHDAVPSVAWVWCGDTGCDAISTQSAAQALEHERRDEAERAEADDRAGRPRGAGGGGGGADEGGGGGGSDAGHESDAIVVRGFATVEDGVEYVEDELLHWAASVRRRWGMVTSFRKYHTKQVQRERHNEVEPNVEDALLPFVRIEVRCSLL
jgi:hypothetical protein